MQSPKINTLAARSVRDPVDRVIPLLEAKDDTSRFVGLTLLKQILDMDPGLRNDEAELASLWNHIPPKFLDRLLRTGTSVAAGHTHARQMLDFAVAVIRAFAMLLPMVAINKKCFERLPKLSAAIPYSSDETTVDIIEIVLVLVHEAPDVKSNEGAEYMARLGLEVWNPFITVAPNHPEVFVIFTWVWLRGTTQIGDQKARNEVRDNIDQGIQTFISSFVGCPPSGLLVFISSILRELDPELIPPNPKWIESLVKLIKNLSIGKQSEEERSAYTNCAATLLQVYPHQAPQLLFSDDPDATKPFAYFLITMLQVDFQSTVHLLLPMTGKKEYPQVSQRLASALEVVAAFIGHLIGTIDEEDRSSSASASEQLWVTLSPENILKIQKDLARTIAEAMEYLRDRWDTIFLATRGDDPGAIAPSRAPSGESSEKLAWDVTQYNFFEDPITPAAIGLVSIWLRDDDGPELRKQGAALMDVLTALYQENFSSDFSSRKMPEMRLLILSALEGILETPEGIEMADTHSLWFFLSSDLRQILQDSARQRPLTAADYLRGRSICTTMQMLLHHKSSTPLAWLTVADEVALYVPLMDADAGAKFIKPILEFQLDALHVGVKLLRKVIPNLITINEKTVESLKDIAAHMSKQWEASSNETLQTVKEELDLYDDSDGGFGSSGSS